uniref:Uncharacterized protein n=1 Tax=Avena sativa TaxID=4498 RepID=A0ACD5WJN1_AVESA
MAEASRAHLRRDLPEEIVVWEILVRLPPKSLFRCRAVCRSWRSATSARPFLLAQHGRQPNLPIISGSKYGDTHSKDVLSFDHRTADAQLHVVARLDGSFNLEASCGGLLVLSNRGTTGTCFCVCNPVSREHAPLGAPWDLSIFRLLGMYLHRPTGEHRLLLHRNRRTEWIVGPLLPKGPTGCYVFALGSDQPPRYIGDPDEASGLYSDIPALVRDSLHWYPLRQRGESRRVLVFDTTGESFRHMCAPPVGPIRSNIFEVDDKLVVGCCNGAMEAVDIWVLQNYEGEVWVLGYSVKLPVEQIREHFGCWNEDLDATVVSVDGDVFLLVNHRGWVFYVSTDGELVGNFHRDGHQTYACDLRLKQTLVPHNLFTAPEGYAETASPFL